jgi:hypothetical protein
MARRCGRLLCAVALVAVLALGTSGGAGAARRGAQAIPGVFNTSIVVANPGDDEATVTLNFRTSDGLPALASPPTFSVRPGSSVLTYVPNIPNLADGRYSVIVESNRYVSVVTNLQSGSPTGGTAYTGIADSNGDYFNTLYAPLVANTIGGYTTSIVVQNGQGAPANVNITYQDGNGNVITNETRTIPAYAASLFDQTGTPNLGVGARSAAITADRFVSALVMVSNNGDGQLGSYRAMRGGDSSIYMPTVYNQYYGWVTTLIYQNVDRAGMGITSSFYSSASGQNAGSLTSAAPVPPGSSLAFNTYDVPGFTSPMPLGFNGSAVARSIEGRILVGVGVVHQTVAGNSNFELYNGVSPSAATTRLTCATVLKNYYGYNTSATVQNVGTASTNLTIAYVDSVGRTVRAFTTPPIPPGAAWFNYTPSTVELPDGFNGALVISSNGQRIVGQVNELFGIGDQPGDRLFAYGCDNTLPGSPSLYRTVSPVVMKNVELKGR